MTKSFLTKTALILACSYLGACMPRTTVPVATEPDLVSLRIAQASEKAASSLDTIAGIEQVRTPVAPPSVDYSSAPPALTQTITVRWSGPLEKMLETMASRAGMSFRVKGKRPPAPVTITVDAYQQPMIEVLHDIGLQAGNRADVRVSDRSNSIEVHYAAPDRM